MLWQGEGRSNHPQDVFVVWKPLLGVKKVKPSALTTFKDVFMVWKPVLGVKRAKPSALTTFKLWIFLKSLWMLIIFYSSGPYKENNQAARQVYGICDRLFSKPYSLPQAAHPGIDLTVTVLTTGFWPSYKSFDLNLPAEMVKCVEVFKGFYETKTKHRKLTWIYSQRRHIMTSSYLYERLWEALQQRIRMITCS
ncbi:hypothetical protein GOBAR_AA26572 [Gossypium barbadense]|uniref:Cullin family profile domain-containing protein n=1 Tax=Gossypium barbadense TaxID=3634 RepID=A0A2P5WSN0_GOSBA|nr:hypothetical protein GOBAR_AA26572 [Gossypium barbadense]